MNTMHHKESGFTLIELMIVIAIIGILAAVAIPAYQDYTVRAKVSEGITMGGSAKTSVSEYYTSQAAMPADADMAGITTGIRTTYVDTIGYALSSTVASVITVTFNEIGGDGNGDTLIFSGTGSSSGVTWACTQGTLEAKYRPANCR